MKDNPDPPVWKECKPKGVRAFQLGDEPEMIYIIPHGKDGGQDIYLVVPDDAYGMGGHSEYLSAAQIKEKFKIEL